MIRELHIILHITIGIFPLLLIASPPSAGIMEEISKQLHLSGGKTIGDCDAVLVSSPGDIFINSVKLHPYRPCLIVLWYIHD